MEERMTFGQRLMLFLLCLTAVVVGTGFIEKWEKARRLPRES